MKKRLFAIILPAATALASGLALAQDDRGLWEPKPAFVATPPDGAPPSDAVVLFDGANLDQWMRIEDGEPARWEIADGAATVTPGTGTIRTRQSFGSLQLHLEWRPTDVIDGSSQSRGNSGVFLHSQFEVQILDSWGKRHLCQRPGGFGVPSASAAGQRLAPTRAVAELRHHFHRAGIRRG